MLSFIARAINLADMKLLYLLLLVLPLSFVFANTGDPIDKTADLIRQGNARELGKSFSPTVELSILGEGDVYSNDRAEAMLADFFKRNPPRSVKVIHRISSNPNYRFAVLILNASSGSFRTSFSLKNVNGRFELNELRIEAEKTK